MKTFITTVALYSSYALALPSKVLGPYESWAAAGPDDFRGPCPMLNTLANHHFLPHDGGAVTPLTEAVVINALHEGLNFNKSLGKVMFQQALPANPEPNATFFTLDMLNVHNVLEHDGSLSRSDAYFGNNHVFNQTIFNEAKKYWTEDVITREHMANSKLARQLQSKASNPEYCFTESVEHFSVGEILAPFIAFGDRESVTVNRRLVEYFFENERLPVELGWTRTDQVVSLSDILRLSEIFDKASTLITVDEAESNATTTSVKRGNLQVEA
ncbi:Putative chloroperoxidase [Septoria linicola]|uniref:Chloroperoxidase n=1 Tax=Septoria linicola TaxID=215465 RepID=A0A9Q9EM34_9PEZI|nr:Putative chloroperoxidase [Septoria linicola]